MRKLIMFPNYMAQVQWLEDNKSRFIQEGVVMNKAAYTLTYPNGDKVVLGHGTDVNPFISCRFNVVEGTDDKRFLALVRSEGVV